MQVLLSFVLGLSATIAASSAVYVAKVAHDFRRTVKKNKRRSKDNRSLLIGKDDPTREGVINRLERIEQGRDPDG